MMDYFEVWNLTTSASENLGFYLEDVSNGYGVRSITGLDPVPAIFNSSSFARMDGEFYHSSRREKRNIVITIGLEPDYTDKQVHELRQNLYRFFAPEKRVWMSFHFSVGDVDFANQYADIIGYVESFDAPLFTDDPEAVISVVCFTPDFFDRVATTYENVSSDTAALPVWHDPLYQGTADTGLLLEIFPDRNISEFSFNVLAQSNNGVGLKFDLQFPFLAGDIIQLTTTVGSKRIVVVRGGVEINLLYAASPFVDWPFLGPGENQVSVQVPGAAVPYKITYNKGFAGL